MPVMFDEGAADALIDAASHAASELLSQGILRRGAAETAADGFAGAFARLFTQACATESEDRGKLAGVLDDLADQVQDAKQKAQTENARQEQLAAWKEREADRERFSETTPSGAVPWYLVALDPMPQRTLTAPPTISAAFGPKSRNRASDGGSSNGKSSADPDRLRTYVNQSRASNQLMSQEVSRMKAAWAGFVGSCSWVRIETATFVGGADRLLAENELDATWIANVASAFEAAGSNSLSNQALNFASTAVSPISDATLLKALAKMPTEDISAILTASPGLQSQLGLIDPVKINEWWAGLNPPQGASTRFSAQQGLLLTSLPILFGNLEGMPYGARDYSNQLALTAEIARFEALEAGIKDQPNISIYGPPAGWLEELEKVQIQLDALRDIRNALKSPPSPEPRYLISMTQDQPPLAAVSIGDLDAAASVTYAVPGMGTTTTQMTGWARSSQNLQSVLPSGSAVVAWIGYKTPAVPLPLPSGDFGVFDVNYAVGGGNKLAAGLGGLAAVRGDSQPDLSIVAHSYGTTTAAVALTQPDVHVENFITVGSAGLPDSVQTASDLNATHVYSGHALNVIPWVEPGRGDQWAWTGTDFSRDHHVNPISPEFDSHAFGTDTGGDTGLPVTDHGTGVDENGAGYLDPNTESLLNVARAIRGEPEEMSPYVPKGPTDLQRILEEVASSGNYSL